MSLAVEKYKNKNPHILLPHKRVMLWLFHFDFKLDANEAKSDGDNADADEAIEADADETEMNEAIDAKEAKADEVDTLEADANVVNETKANVAIEAKAKVANEAEADNLTDVAEVVDKANEDNDVIATDNAKLDDVTSVSKSF